MNLRRRQAVLLSLVLAVSCGDNSVQPGSGALAVAEGEDVNNDTPVSTFVPAVATTPLTEPTITRPVTLDEGPAAQVMLPTASGAPSSMMLRVVDVKGQDGQFLAVVVPDGDAPAGSQVWVVYLGDQALTKISVDGGGTHGVRLPTIDSQEVVLRVRAESIDGAAFSDFVDAVLKIGS